MSAARVLNGTWRQALNSAWAVATIRSRSAADVSSNVSRTSPVAGLMDWMLIALLRLSSDVRRCRRDLSLQSAAIVPTMRTLDGGSCLPGAASAPAGPERVAVNEPASRPAGDRGVV